MHHDLWLCMRCCASNEANAQSMASKVKLKAGRRQHAGPRVLHLFACMQVLKCTSAGAAHQRRIGVVPAQVKPTVREGLLVLKVFHKARNGTCEARIVVDGHLIVGSTAPTARVFETTQSHSRMKWDSRSRIAR